MKILVLPKDTNPYQELLYNHMPNKITKKYLTWPVNKLSILIFMPSLIMQLIYNRMIGFNTIHLHWTYPFSVDNRVPMHRYITTLNHFVFINALAILKYKIVWTVHNILPHEQESLNDTKVVRRIIKRSTLVIVHSSQILKEMADLGFETRNTRVIPIGSYDNIYTNTYSVHAARQKLLIKKNEIVILFFGIVRPYKGLEILIKAIRILNSANIKLIIAGKATENEYMLSLRTQSEGLRVEFYDQFIPDEDVCLYFAACDLVCLPFKKITTSSSVLLGMAFKKAVVVPKMGIMHDFPENSAFFYTNSTAEDLVKILRIAINQQSLRKVVELNGYEYSKSLNWQNISKLTYEAFREIL